MAMQFETAAMVQGVAKFEGVIDGKTLDSGTFFILEELDDKSGNLKGSRTTENKAANSEVVKRIMDQQFPCKLKLVYERQVSKSGEKLVIIDAKPVHVQQQKAA